MKVDPYPRFPEDQRQLVRKLTDLFRQYGQEINNLGGGAIASSFPARSAVPSSGTWDVGNFVPNSAPVEGGSGGSKYVVIGWVRLTSGSNNVLNTDWVACRCLTGN